MKRIQSPKVFAVLLILFFIGVSLLIFNTIYQGTLPKIVEEINNGALGAIIAAIITVLLLSQQSQSEENKERNVKVFEQKAQNFKMFIDDLWDKWSDFRIEPQELEDIRQHFYRSVYIYLGKESLDTIAQEINKISEFIGKDLEDEPRRKARLSIFKIISTLKNEIGLKNFDDEKILDKIDAAFNKASKVSEAKEGQSRIATTSKGTITFWHFVMFDDKRQREILEGKDPFLVVGDGEEESGKRTGLVKQISKNDIIFLYSRGYGYVGVVEASDLGRSIPKGSSERIMNPNEGSEGQVAVKSLLFLSNENSVKRDAPRVSTIQRIYDIAAIKKLLKGFEDKRTPENENKEFEEIVQDVMKQKVES